ncbi:SDR family NAD(P)-dependent oxidoreductase [Streptomyces poonensis]|uniref:Short-chain dehydrogenase/reductase n=1 Tax=Streptomyces poonensis TaxID=68255 RepID=A0A918UEQ7_9ACTN|nr:SDR family oxidoreductase [Streptomyces poonensis]GGZ01563.1 short-chain dehydrogenase/reductase [Streptomyces poonensis]GLJ90313.1 short-chain dehydrogenase/reductase [Streptomyces poonensis]
MDLGLEGRAALVAASTSGLGLAVARALAAEGADVAICGRDRDRLARAQEEVDGCGKGRVLGSTVDLRDEHAVAAWVDHVAQEFGNLHIAVTNSGGVPFGPVDGFTVAEYRAAVNDNLLPHVALSLAAAPHLIAAGWGRIILVTSESVRQPHPGSGLSSVARLGVLGLVKGLVHSFGAAGVTVNVLAPGFHRTPILDRQYGPEAERRIAEIARELPLGRIGRAQDLGSLAAFLASEQAGFVTGTVLVADGGNTRGIG